MSVIHPRIRESVYTVFDQLPDAVWESLLRVDLLMLDAHRVVAEPGDMLRSINIAEEGVSAELKRLTS